MFQSPDLSLPVLSKPIVETIIGNQVSVAKPLAAHVECHAPHLVNRIA